MLNKKLIYHEDPNCLSINIISGIIKNELLTSNKILFYAAAASTSIAGALHLAIVPMFFAQMPLNVIVFFIISGLVQMFWVIPVVKRWSKPWYYVGTGGTAVLIILWVVAVPHNGLSELEVAIEMFQIVFIILCSVIIAKSRTIPKFEAKNV
jgi:hypothetical protein